MKNCGCDHPEFQGQLYQEGTCRTCWNYYNNPEYRAYWDGLPSPSRVPEEKWPWIVRVFAQLRREGEKGLGDTTGRLVPGGEKFKKLFKKLTGADCGCENRQNKLNQMYPYVE